MSVAEESTAQPRGRSGSLDVRQKRELVAALANIVIAHSDELTALDSAIGDGDHGHNMKRGFEAVLQDVDAFSAMSLPDLLKAVGTKLVMKVGGASGPLYGTLFLTLARNLSERPSRVEAAAAFAAAISAVAARGKSAAGQKTMLDVLIPACQAFAAGGDPAAVRKAAAAAADATTMMRATRGRASFLGERSIGHMDPGARSSFLMIDAACEQFGAD